MYSGDRPVTVRFVLYLLAVCVGVVGATSVHAQSPVIIDHTCTDLSQVPQYWIDQAKDMFRMSYGHTSHGSQIATGMETLNGVIGCSCGSCGDAGCGSCLYGYCDDYAYYSYGGGNPVAPSGTLSLWDGKPEGASDLGNPDRTQWEVATRAMLDDPRYENRNLVMWSWCGQADGSEAQIQQYLDLMNGLEADYPDVTFVYMTGHLNGTGEEGNLHQRNNQIRQHCIANNAVLFDFADIESYNPDGNYFLDLYADDGCNYQGGNWADEWCDAHPGSDLCAPCSCAHSEPLNCNLKARAFWWMMARLAGWPGPGNGTSTTTLPPTTTTTLPPPSCEATPVGGCLGPDKGMLLVNESVPGREKIKAVFKKLKPGIDQSQFGDPITGQTSYNLCIYDDADALVGQMRVGRAQDNCGTPPRSCWRAIPDGGYEYCDQNAAADGIRKIILKAGGVGKAKIMVKGKNDGPKGQTSLPTGIAGALNGKARATVQVVSSDADCFGINATDVRKADGALFKARGAGSAGSAFLDLAGDPFD